jgi:hypothetical protein
MPSTETKKSIWPKAALLLIVALGAAGFYGQSRLHLFVKPCSAPIEYSLGNFDPRFGISQQDFLAAVDKAAAIWELPSGRNLFQYNPSGRLKINLIYDKRQEATDKLKSLGLTIDDTRASYDSLKIRYDSVTADYQRLKQNLDSEAASYNTRRQAYEQQVQYWNNQGGAPRNVVNQLNTQAADLNAQAERIKRDQDTLNSLVDTINPMVDVLNRMAKNLNLSVASYNSVGQSRGTEFEEGAYIENGASKRIDIYEFDSKDKLIRVLAHELGHSLGLAHIDTNPEAIMYRLNQGLNEKATKEDIQALTMLCGT